MSTDARLQERPISQTILPQPRRTAELSALPIPHVPARSSHYAALPPYASNRNGSRYPGSRLTDRLRTLRTQLNAQARALTEPLPPPFGRSPIERRAFDYNGLEAAMTLDRRSSERWGEWF